MKFFRKEIFKREFKVHLSKDKECMELHSNGELHYTIEIRDIINIHYFKPKQFAANNKYWLNLNTRKNGKLFFPTQFLDESFIKDFLKLVPYAQLKEMENRSLKRQLFYYSLPLILVGVYLTKFEEQKFNGLLALGLFFFFFNSIAIYNEYAKFKIYKKIKQE